MVTDEMPDILANSLWLMLFPLSMDARYRDAVACPIGCFPSVNPFFSMSPKIVVGTIKKKRRTVYAVYIPAEKKTSALNSEIFYNPFVILHEYYHHIRSKLGVHRGSEKHANMFAKKFIYSYRNTENL